MTGSEQKKLYKSLMSELENLKRELKTWKKSNLETELKRQAAKEYPVYQDFPGFARMEEIEKALMSEDAYRGSLLSGSIKFGNDD